MVDCALELAIKVTLNIVLCCIRRYIDGRTKAKVKEIGCYADHDDDRDLPEFGPPGADRRFCMINYCVPNVSPSRLSRLLLGTKWKTHRKPFKVLCQKPLAPIENLLGVTSSGQIKNLFQWA